PKPPEPSSSSRACTFTITSSPSATGPVSRGYAMHAVPSTSSRTRPSCRSSTAVTVPRLSESGIDQRQRHVDHRLEVRDGDSLVGRVNVRHPVREVQALQPAFIEHVRVRGAAAQSVARLVPAARESGGGELHDLVVALEAITAI